MTATFAEYIWIDGTKPTAKLRSKTKVIHTNKAPGGQDHFSFFPDWSFDGSSTGQAPGDSSDCILKPVFYTKDPTRPGEDAYLVMCEVFDAEGAPHATNARAKLREVIGLDINAAVPEGGPIAEKMDCWFGLEQEYTLFKDGRPAGFPSGGFPAAQGPYYCGVGYDEVVGRPLVEAHMVACAKAGLKISGINAEVMPGQWEFQVGPAGPLECGDHLWLARWLLYRLGEDHGLSATLDPKPAKGDWNGAGMHTNFSTRMMRKTGTAEDFATQSWGMDAIHEFCHRAGKHVQEHLAAYGHGYESRLTGDHETASYRDFTYGISDRGASIRIPLATSQDGYGYLEDRRPNANADPYAVAAVMMKTAYDLW